MSLSSATALKVKVTPTFSCLPRFLLARSKVQAAGDPGIRWIQDVHQAHKKAVCSCVQYLEGATLGSVLLTLTLKTSQF